MKRITRKLLFFVILYIAHGATPFAALQQPDELISKGTTYNVTQVTAWLSKDRFAVARWDGTLSIFRPPANSTESGPMLTQVVMAPSSKAVEMVAPVSQRLFVTSNDDGSLAVWVSKNSHFVVASVPQYNPKYGTANSAALLERAGKPWLITGHSQGYLIIWEVVGFRLIMKQTVLMRSPNPIPSPYKLWNVRGIVPWKNGIVATGAEDGDICLVSVPDGEILVRTRYNPAAQRGINSISIYDDYLILANCSVGPSDKNLWLYTLRNNEITLRDSFNLIKNTSLPQVYDFSVQLAPLENKMYFFACTQEGLLWMGRIENDKLAIISNTKVACDFGAAIAFQPKSWMLSVVAFDIRLYTLLSKP